MMNLDSPAKLIYGVILIIAIVYSSVIPTEYRIFADSMLGRVFGVALVYGVIETHGMGLRYTHGPRLPPNH
jgi:hypothetical protein